MTGSQKAIKVISIIVIIVAILSILAGLTSCLGGFMAVGIVTEGTIDDQEVAALGAGLLFILGGGAVIGGVIDLIVGLLGLRGAKNPEKIMPFFVIAIIGAIWSIINLVSCFMANDTSNILSGIIDLVLMAICVVLANNVRKMRA